MRKYFVIFILITSHLFSQVNNSEKEKAYEFNISIESTLLFGIKDYQNINKKESFDDIYPASFHISGLVFLSNKMAFEFKPGFIIGGEYYSGFELGFNLRYYIYNQRIFTSCGLNIHQNFGSAHGTSVSVWATDESLSYLALQFGYKFDSSFILALGYYRPFKNYSYFSIADYEGDYYIGKVDNIIKLGFSIIL